MNRLRLTEGLSLEAIGKRTGVGRERVRQLLNLYLGLTGKPPSAAATRQRRR